MDAARTMGLPNRTIVLRHLLPNVLPTVIATVPAPTPVWVFPRSLGPSGIICSTAADVLAFARAHLTGGLAPDGTRVLSAVSAAAMTEHTTDVPTPTAAHLGWGLGWMRFAWDGHPLFGHDGGTVGQNAFLRILPEAGLAVALLTNGGATGELYEDLYREIFGELAGVELPRPIASPNEPITVDHRRHLGTYERSGHRCVVSERDGRLMLRATLTGPLVGYLGERDEEFPLVPVDDSGDRFACRAPWARNWELVTFYTPPGGVPGMDHDHRTTPKVT